LALGGSRAARIDGGGQSLLLAVMAFTLVVLAAGMGSRYGGLKQIEPVGPSGETVLDYAVFDAIRAGFERVVFVIRRDFESQFRESVGVRYAAGLTFVVRFNRAISCRSVLLHRPRASDPGVPGTHCGAPAR